MRRVVTGVDPDGRSVVLSDGACPRTTAFSAIPGMVSTLVWATEPGHGAGSDTTESVSTFVPAPGGSRLILLTLPPDQVTATPEFDAAQAVREQLDASPGLAELFDPDSPGMHSTPTVDYVIVLSGELLLELGDGDTVELRRGDIVVQNRARHAWRNPSTEPAQIACILLGAPRPIPTHLDERTPCQPTQP